MALSNTRQFLAVQTLNTVASTHEHLIVLYQYDFSVSPFGLMPLKRLIFQQDNAHLYSITAVAEVDTKTLLANGGVGDNTSPQTSFYVAIAMSSIHSSTNSYIAFVDIIA